MLTDVDVALDTLALVTSLDYLSPLLLEPIPIQGQEQVRHRHKKKSCDKIIPAMINGEAEEGERDGRRARMGHCLQGLDYAQGKAMTYTNWIGLVYCHVVSCYPSFFSLYSFNQ